MTTPTGEPSQAAMERARELLDRPCPHCLDHYEGRYACSACRGGGKAGLDARAVAIALDLHAAAAVQEERERCAKVCDDVIAGMRRQRPGLLPLGVIGMASGIKDAILSPSALGQGEGKAQNPNPPQQPTTGTGGDDG